MGLFGEVLGLCAKAGIVDVSVVAVDGTKLAAAASDGAIASYEQAAAGLEAHPAVVVADAGYWSNEHIDSLRERGIIPLIVADTTRNRPARPDSAGPMTSCAE